MIFIIDGGSLLNQTPDLFLDGKNVIDVVEPFFERFSEVLIYRGHSAFFILRGISSKDSRLPRRLPYGAFTLVFSNFRDEEETLMMENIELSIEKDETIIVTDNPVRSDRAAFLGARPMKCAEFETFIYNSERKMIERESVEEDDEESVEYWSDVFGVSTEFTVDLSKTKPRKRLSIEGITDEQ